MNNINTKLTTMGRNCCEDGGFPSVNIPVYRASTLVFSNLEEFNAADAGRHQYPGYGIYGNPTTQALSDTICEMEEADGTLLVSSGLTAVMISFMAFVKSGDHVLVSDSVYGPTRDFCDNELSRFSIEATYFDPSADGDMIASLLQDNTSLIFLESPGSLTFEMQDFASIAKTAKVKNPDIVIVGDNTWATPIYLKPFNHGIDVSVQALTKYVGGHSDLLMGSVSAKGKHLQSIKRACKSYGTRVTGDECYLALRGIRTMSVRMDYQQKSALKIAQWLQSRDEVKQVLYPALPDDEFHDRYLKYMNGGAALFAFELQEDIDDGALAAMLDHMTLFKLGFSWGGFESLIISYKPGKLRKATADKWGIDRRLIRINIGLEDTDDLIADIEAGLKRIKEHAKSNVGQKSLENEAV